VRFNDIDLLNMLFGRKAHSDRRKLLASMDQMAVGRPVDNGELNYSFNVSLRTRLLCGISTDKARPTRNMCLEYGWFNSSYVAKLPYFWCKGQYGAG